MIRMLTLMISSVVILMPSKVHAQCSGPSCAAARSSAATAAPMVTYSTQATTCGTSATYDASGEWQQVRKGLFGRRTAWVFVPGPAPSQSYQIVVPQAASDNHPGPRPAEVKPDPAPESKPKTKPKHKATSCDLCQCGCDETGKCLCRSCNDHTADPNYVPMPRPLNR